MCAKVPVRDAPEKEQRKEFEKLGIETIETSSLAYAKASYRSATYGVIGVVKSLGTRIGGIYHYG